MHRQSDRLVRGPGMILPRGWNAAPRAPSLAGGDVDVWRACLDLCSIPMSALAGCLSDDEHEKAGRFRFERDRRRFIARRGALRVILAGYLGVAPCAIAFRYGPHGKPALRSGGGGTLGFSVSYADGVALYAVTAGREVGVDLERVRPDVLDEKIAQRVLAPGELQALHAADAGSRPMAFFKYWTRKEAYLKARGVGLSVPPDQCDLAVVPGKPAVVRWGSGGPREAGDWSVRDDIPAGPGYVAAVAVAGRSCRLRCWQWLGI